MQTGTGTGLDDPTATPERNLRNAARDGQPAAMVELLDQGVDANADDPFVSHRALTTALRPRPAPLDLARLSSHRL